MASRARLDDLQWLAEHIEVVMPLADRQHKDRLARLQDWMATVIDTRVAQITQPETDHHKRLMETLDQATIAWRARREHETRMWKTELSEWEKENPAPTLKSILINQQRRKDQVEACDCPIVVEHHPTCPLYEDERRDDHDA